VSAAGATPVLVARSADRLHAAAREVGDESLAVVCDVSDSRSVAEMFETVQRRHGRVDGLVNNAAVAWPHRIEDVTEAEVAAEIGTNFAGPLWTSRAAVPLLRQAGGGDIVNISTESVRDPFPYLGLYAATKAGMEVLTEALARELRDEPIRVCLLVAGRTSGGEFTAHWPAQARRTAEEVWDREGYRARVSGTTPQPPERVAAAVVFVLSQPAGSTIDRISVRSHPASTG
jgi:NAD(P)-dependent dehydrogenase (short-subunit alcohol dehydrogenase family)